MTVQNEVTAGGGASYTYDNNGNTLTKADSSGTTTYTWDFENHLTSVHPPSETTVTFKYDPFGRRIQKAGSVFVYDGANLIETADASGYLVARYVFGSGIDEPFAAYRSGTWEFYEADGLGSVTSLSTSTGTMSDNFVYDSVGNVISSTGASAQPFRYTGREWDAETGLYYYRARYYDAEIGRFLNEDLFGNDEGLNLYAYVGNDPINFRDPTGLYKLVGFPPDKEQQMKDAIDAAIKKLKEGCPSCAGPGGPKIVKALETATYVYDPDNESCGVNNPILFFRHITVSALAFDPARCCVLASTLTHEASHRALNTTDADKPGSAWEIEKKCFNCGTGHPVPKAPKKPRKG